MAVDNSKVLFSSNWDIDQATTNGFVSQAISANVDTSFYTFSGGNVPVFDVQFKPSGENNWYLPGQNMNAADSGFYFQAYALGSNLYAKSTIAGTIRYIIYMETIT